MDTLSLLHPLACTQRGRACGQGRAGHINWGLGWHSPGGTDWPGALPLLHTHLCEAGRGRGNRGAQRGRPCEWGNLCEGGCEHVGVPEMVRAGSPLAPLVCVERIGSADGEGARKRGARTRGAVNEGDGGHPSQRRNLPVPEKCHSLFGYDQF